MKDPVKNIVWAKYPLGDITQWFGENKKLYSTMDLAGHNGIDIVRPWGEHLFAVEDFTVAQAREDETGHGKHIRAVATTPDENGYYRDWVYGHLSYIAVKNGQRVKSGQYIGNMGNTGFVVSGNTPYWGTNPYAGTHLHFGVRLLKKLTSGGFKYVGLPTTSFEVVDYNNGFKGRFDPLRYFKAPMLKSTKVLLLASARQDKTLLGLANLLAKIGL